MRSAKADQSPQRPAESVGDDRLPSLGQSYIERLAVVYLDPLRLTIITELYMREMGARQFYETIGGSSYATVRRHFARLVDFGWLQYVRTVSSGRGRPEKLFRSTELAVIDTATWRTIPFSIRDAFTAQALEEMGSRLGEALTQGLADGRPDSIAEFRTMEVDELAWCEAYAAVERCFHALLRKQTDARIRLENSDEQPHLIVVNLAAFEAARPVSASTDGTALPLPKAVGTGPQPWPRRVGKVFMDRGYLAIVNELNREAKTPKQLQAFFGGATSRAYYLRRCNRLVDLGWAVTTDEQTAGSHHGGSSSQFRAAAPNVTESDISGAIPRVARKGRTWEVFERFIATAINALDAGTFNNRPDRHLTESPLLIDEMGCAQVVKVLKTFEGDLLRVEDDLAERRQRARKFTGFPAAFLLSSFEAPLRKVSG